jgi:hypothetical protein
MLGPWSPDQEVGKIMKRWIMFCAVGLLMPVTALAQYVVRT